jgi:predicted transcriptional regulator
MKSEKRSKCQIYLDVLQVLSEEIKMNNKFSLTRIAHRTNLPYDRFQNCMDRLIQLDMVSHDSNGRYVVTGKGLEYMEEYSRINEFLKRMGL